MQDLLIIPTYERPEMLWLCLEYLAASPDATTVSIWVVVDAHIQQPSQARFQLRQEIMEVLRKFPQLSCQVEFRTPHNYHGNSYNLMTAYQDACRTQAHHVFMVEEDILIQPSFFAWHREQHRLNANLGCSIGVSHEPQHSIYASLGVCFRQEMLRLILPHCRRDYWSDMRGYCRSEFPPMGNVDCEQDGVFCRVLRNRSIVWAVPPVAQHVGWYGYHRRLSTHPAGSLESRFSQVKTVLSSEKHLKLWAKEFGDVRPIVAVEPR